MSPSTRIAAAADLAHLAMRLRTYLAPATGLLLPVTRGSGNGAINLSLDPGLASLGPDGYTLRVEANRVDLKALTPAGIFYAMQTFRELFPPDIFRKSAITGVEWKAPACRIADSPRFSWRGAHMDVARHFEPKEFVERFLDEMALHKLNVFHWHLVDDNGWRIEIKQYPLLTKKGSSTDFSAMNPKEATRSASVIPGGFYTQDDVREVVQYAADRFITVVPEIEMPGHSLAAIRAYPALGNRSEMTGSNKLDAGADNVYNVDDTTIQFLQNVLTEVMELFPSKFIHVGGDEVDKNPWKMNSVAQQKMHDLGPKNEDELQSWFIHQMDTFLTSKGRRLVGWDEILEGGLAPGATVMSWRGIEGGIAAAKSGHDVVMTPTSHTYFDYYQSRDTKHEPPAIGGYLPLRDVYAYEPIPAALQADEAKHVLGSQGQLWSEYIPGPRHMEYMAFPRLCALAEVVWSSPQDRSYAEFLERLVPHLQRLTDMDVAYRQLSPEDLKP